MKEALAELSQAFGNFTSGERLCVGTIVEVDEQGYVAVDFSGNTKGPVQAYYTNALKTQLEAQAVDLIDQKVLLVFDEDELELPIIVDTLHSRISQGNETLEVDTTQLDDVTVDGQRISFDAREEIILRCGKSSLRLTKAGKVIIRGAYLLNRSSGVNRIKGGSVQIN